MQSLITHLHAFIRDIEPTEQEWITAIEWLTRTGKLSTDKRQEFILASDVHHTESRRSVSAHAAQPSTFGSLPHQPTRKPTRHDPIFHGGTFAFSYLGS